MDFEFEARIYKVGINACVDVPDTVTSVLIKEKGFIYIKGTMNNAPFSKSLVPVKNYLYRLFVDLTMLKEANVQIGDTAKFNISQAKKETIEYEIPDFVKQALDEKKLLNKFYALSDSKRKSILKYLCSLKTMETLKKNTSKLILGLESEIKDIRLP
ncbi:DUF1905 domain-containing protein [Lacrimispora brassicae]